VIKWTSLPFKVGGKKNLIAICIPILVWITILLLWGVGWFILSVIVLGVSILPYFMPTTYILTKEDIYVNSLFAKQRKKWEYFKTFYVDHNGIFLSPFDKPSRLENYRGLYVRFHKNRDEVLQFVKTTMGQTDEK